ncbi:MAG TPA: FtsL-like putative cell division protein [Puia sp.]|jgi:hypothetical protein
MKKKTRDQEAALPWEDTAEEPQKVSAVEASAAAAVKPGQTTGNKAGSKTTDPAPPGRYSARSRWKPSALGYQLIMRNIRFFLFLAALAVIYIYNGHYADKVARDINRTNKELKELQYEYKTLKSEVMFRSKQSELAKAVEPFGLKELILPPYVLIDSTQKNKN